MILSSIKLILSMAIIKILLLIHKLKFYQMVLVVVSLHFWLTHDVSYISIHLNYFYKLCLEAVLKQHRSNVFGICMIIMYNFVIYKSNKCFDNSLNRYCYILCFTFLFFLLLLFVVKTNNAPFFIQSYCSSQSTFYE